MSMRRLIIPLFIIFLLGSLSLNRIGLGQSAAAYEAPAKPLTPSPAFSNPIVTNVDVLIDVGHGGIDSGTLHGSILEKDINLKMAQLTYKLLREKGFTVMVNRMDDYALSEENSWLRARSRHLKDLAQRSQLANEIHPKAMISLHVNWSGNSTKRGPLLLFQKSEASIRLANSIQQSMNQLYGTDTKPVYGKPYYLLKHVRVPAVIVEMGFISNRMDREQMMQPKKQQQLADSIVNGVILYLKNTN